MPTRRKPRSNHVRTGCITCKRRKVKCTEERPHCDRCVRGGFVCAGYAIPKAWVFDSRVEAQTRTKADRTESKPSDVQLTDSKSLVNQSIPSVWQSFHSLVRSPLQLGNSDPFYSYAVPIGPRENYLLTVYQDLVAPHICGSRHKNSTNIGRVYLECLKNEATACALFARNSAVEGLILRGRHAKPSAFYIGYANRSYAVLRHRLSLMDGSETAATVRAMIQSTCLLAVAAMFTDFTTTEVHLRAMGKLVVRYAELIGGHAGKEPTLITTYIEIIRAYATLPRPTITMQGWFLRLAQDIQDSTTVSQKDARINNSDPTIVHADAQDKSLGDITVSWREEIGGYHGISQDRKLSRGEAELHKTAEFSESVFQHSLSLGALLNALERLKSSGMNSEQAQHDSIRVSMALSELIWVQVTSPTTVFTDILFNLTPSLLRQVKGIIKRDVCVRNRLLGHEEAYTNGQLWAILVASFLQLHGKAIQGSDLVCGDCVTIMQQSAASRT